MDCTYNGELLESDEESSQRYSTLNVRFNCPFKALVDDNIQDITYMQSGLVYASSLPFLPNVLHRREAGTLLNQIARYSPLNLTKSYRSYIASKHLPSTKQHVERFDQRVFCGFYSKNGHIFLSAAQDFRIRLYDTRSDIFKLIRNVSARDVGWSILDLDLSPDGALFAYTSWSDYINLCSVNDANYHETMRLSSSERIFGLFSIKFSHDGHEILGGANNGNVYIYNREIGTRTHRIKCHPDDINTVGLADSSSSIFFTGSDDGFVKVWDRRTLNDTSPAPVGCFVGHRDGIVYIDPRGDGRHLISNSKDQSIKLWDMRKFCPADQLPESIEFINADWDYRWQDVPKEYNTSVSRPHYLKEHTKMDNDTSILTFRGHQVKQTLIRCHFSPMATTGQRYIYTGCGLGFVYIYDILSGGIVRKLEGHKGCVRDVSWHPEFPDLVSSSWDKSVIKWTYAEDDWMYDCLISSNGNNSRRRSKRIAQRNRELGLINGPAFS